MINIKNFHNQIVEIKEFQTSYVILKIENKLLRFDFKKKKEAYLKQKEIGILGFYENHPLLINYNESFHEVFINSKLEDPEMFIEDIKNIINEMTEGWKDWKDYIEFNTGINYQTFLQNIYKGSGKLLNAPFSMVAKIETICEKHNVKVSYFGEKRIYKNQLVLINNQFIIAEEFSYKSIYM